MITLTTDITVRDSNSPAVPNPTDKEIKTAKGSLAALRAHLTRATKTLGIVAKAKDAYTKATVMQEECGRFIDPKAIREMNELIDMIVTETSAMLAKHGLAGDSLEYLDGFHTQRKIDLEQRIQGILLAFPSLANTATNTKRRSSSRSKRFIEDDGKVDRAAISKRYDLYRDRLNAHFARLFPQAARIASKDVTAVPAPSEHQMIVEAPSVAPNPATDDQNDDRCLTTEAVFSEIDAKPITFKAKRVSERKPAGKRKTKAA